LTAPIAAIDELRASFGDGRVTAGVPLSTLTTFRVGGTADWLVETRSSEELLSALRIAADGGLAVTLIGGGSNVLVSDAGVRGLVIRPRGGDVRDVRGHGPDPGIVRADASVTINGLVRWTINHGRAGLEAWAGTPGTVGGAVFGNAHFGGRLVSELIVGVRLATRAGESLDVDVAAMGFGYDRSRLQDTGEVLLSADFRVTRGDPPTLRATARESLAFRKRTQPLDTPSAGCIFQNPQRGVDAVPDGIPWSAGALVDRAGLKGATSGGARVSPTHGNFIVNEGGATAADIRRLVEHCKVEVRQRFGVSLREEIVYLGDWSTFDF
jgi:UDP-N-acetylmuramate dehydrogenase